MARVEGRGGGAAPRCPGGAVAAARPIQGRPPAFDAGYAIDITIPALRVAIEADGPTHLARNDMRRMLGATAMKRRHLRKLGWQTVNISFQQWNALQGEAARTAFLQRAIDEAVAAQVEVQVAAAAAAAAAEGVAEGGK
jgi:hypothetical protein